MTHSEVFFIFKIFFYLTQGDHFFRTNLERWPFETQTLELIVEFNEQFQGEVSLHLTSFIMAEAAGLLCFQDLTHAPLGMFLVDEQCCIFPSVAMSPLVQSCPFPGGRLPSAA